MNSDFQVPRPLPNPFPVGDENPLGSDWPIDQDGYPGRYAARIVAFDSRGRILLISGHDFSDPTHRWWFTPGGGIEGGETREQAALREFKEETGITLERDQLQGPVLYRESFAKVSQTLGYPGRTLFPGAFKCRCTPGFSSPVDALRKATFRRYPLGSFYGTCVLRRAGNYLS